LQQQGEGGNRRMEKKKTRKYCLITGEENGSMNYIFIASSRLLLSRFFLFEATFTVVFSMFFILLPP